MKSRCALILPGAVAKGAYEAGVIEVLADHDVRVDRIVATSSGALNGVAYAAGIRCGREKEMAAKLVQAWIDKGSWQGSLNFNPWNWLKGSGLSNGRGLMQMLQDLVTPCAESTPKRRDVELRIIVAPLRGVVGEIGNRQASTYEKFLHFSGPDFDTPEGLARIFDATTAACAFPGLFAPVEIPGLGPCIDGGTVNNAPIRYALDEGDVNRIIMPVPFPSMMPAAASMQGLNLMNHLIEILINERLYRDLKDAQVVNREVAALENLVTQGVLTAQQYQAVHAVLKTRSVEITEVRPAESLGGNSFSGFFSKQERIRLVEDGRKAARQALSDEKRT